MGRLKVQYDTAFRFYVITFFCPKSCIGKDMDLSLLCTGNWLIQLNRARDLLFAPSKRKAVDIGTSSSLVSALWIMVPEVLLLISTTCLSSVGSLSPVFVTIGPLFSETKYNRDQLYC